MDVYILWEIEKPAGYSKSQQQYQKLELFKREDLLCLSLDLFKKKKEHEEWFLSTFAKEKEVENCKVKVRKW